MLDDFPSLRAQRDAFREAAERDIAAARPAGRRYRGRVAALALAATALGAGGVAVATELIAVGEPRPDQVSRRAEQLPQTQYAIVATARDEPLSWGVGIYAGADKRECAVVGQVRGGRLGAIRDGTFRPLAPGTAGPCRPAGRRTALFEVAFRGDRTIAFGRVQAGARRVELIQRDGRVRTATPATGGAFLFVFDRATTAADFRALVVRDAAGRRLQ